MSTPPKATIIVIVTLFCSVVVFAIAGGGLGWQASADLHTHEEVQINERLHIKETLGRIEKLQAEDHKAIEKILRTVNGAGE